MAARAPDLSRRRRLRDRTGGSPGARLSGDCVCARGGALETVRRNRTGVFFDEQNAGALRRAVQDSEQKNFPVRNFRENARRFTRAAFQRKLMTEVRKLLDQGPSGR